MSERVLLIDDDEAFTRMMALALSRRGYEVTSINSESAIDAAIAETAFDFILLDLMLGEVSSIGRIASICETQPQARLIMLTGYASIPATVQAVRSGAVNLLAKPVGVNEVVAAMQQAAEQGEQSQSPAPATDAETASRMGVRRLEWEHIQRVLAEHDGNISAAARAMGMHRRTLQRKLMKKAPIR